VEKILAEKSVFRLKDLAINGKDLMAMGIAPGKMIGTILNELLETVLDDPAQNTCETLLHIAGKMYDLAPESKKTQNKIESN
jgi:poly(A) polymerase/tRNA nucleotidyltransferase (CCA-adding enzyme)